MVITGHKAWIKRDKRLVQKGCRVMNNLKQFLMLFIVSAIISHLKCLLWIKLN